MNKLEPKKNSFSYKLGRFVAVSIVILLWILTISLIGGLGFKLAKWIIGF